MPKISESDPVSQESTKKPTKAEKEERAPLTIMVGDRIGKQIRLLASLSGQTISEVVLAAVEREIPAKLKAALADLDPSVRG